MENKEKQKKNCLWSKERKQRQSEMMTRYWAKRKGNMRKKK